MKRGLPVLALRADCIESIPVPISANGHDKLIYPLWNSSGQLNAKQQELLELQALAQRRLKGVRANFAEGLKTARETKRDLEWTQKRVR